MGITGKIPQNNRIALQSLFVVVNAFIWYFIALIVLEDLLNTNSLQTQLFWAVHFATLTVCLIAGTLLTKKIGRNHLFTIWTLLGIVSPFALFALNFASTPVTLFCSIFFAASIGLGMPNCMEYFVRSTSTGSRGRYAGLLLLMSGVGLFALRMIGEGIVISAIVLIIWRFIGLLAILRIKPLKENKEKDENYSYKSVIQQRSFLLYLVPWIMFSLVNYLSTPVSTNILGQQMFTTLEIIENAISGVSAILAGFLIDRVGRKQASIAGFALLGVTYAILGFYPNSITSAYLYIVFDGITWGILGILFVVCIWGELNPHAPTDKYYALGILPFFTSRFIGQALATSIAASVEPYTLFSFTAFFLFLSVLPLVYAPETLPEKLMKDRDLKSYADKALMKMKKDAEKNQKVSRKAPEKNRAETNVKTEDDDEKYAEAKRLAEKYY
jgi:MFS family permease